VDSSILIHRVYHAAPDNAMLVVRHATQRASIDVTAARLVLRQPVRPLKSPAPRRLALLLSLDLTAVDDSNWW
jgi:hypothetical protein